MTVERSPAPLPADRERSVAPPGPGTVPHVGHARMLRAAGALRSAGKALSAEALAAEWASVDALKASTEDPVRAAFAALLQEQAAVAAVRWEAAGRRVVAEAAVERAEAEALGESRKAEDRFPVGDDRAASYGALLLDLDEWAAGIADEFGPVLAGVLEAGFATGAVRAGAASADAALDLAFALDGRAAEALAEGVGMVQGTTEVSRLRLGHVIGRGLERGADVDEIGRDIAATFADWTDGRARTVARTEATRAFEAGQVDAYVRAGLGRKRWLSQRDGDVRAEHDALDGEEVDVDAAFSNGLEYPSEPNCRCTTVPVATAKAAPRPAPTRPPKRSTWAQRRNAHIRAAYRAEVGYGNRGVLIEELRSGVFEGEPYDLAPSTCRKICDTGSA